MNAKLLKLVVFYGIGIWSSNSAMARDRLDLAVVRQNASSDLAKRYRPRGAYLPYSEQCPWACLSESMYIPRDFVLNDKDKRVLRDIYRLFNYLKRKVSKSDEKIMDTLESIQYELLQARKEGVGGKGNYASVRAVDGLVSVATHLLTQNLTKEKKDELKKLLLLTKSNMRALSRNYSALPYLENTAKNLAIASRILRIDLSFK
jgi:hypothetical protein